VSKEFIPFGQPMVGEAERQAVAKVLSGSTLVHGPVTHEFEKQFASRIGVNHAISVSSCTAGLHLLLFARDIGPGDEVIVPAMTHVATAHAVEFCGAKPVFVDVRSESGNLDHDQLISAINTNTKAVMPVHYLGLPCDMAAISLLCEKYDACVIEDCALAMDATYDGMKAGSLGLAGSFSFYPIKHLTTIEGGMVTTDDDRLAEDIAKRRAFGYDRSLGERAKPGIYDVNALGYNYRMNEVEAAIGLAQLTKLDSFQEARASNYSKLREGLLGLEEITIFDNVQGKAKSSHYCLNVVLPRDGKINRDKVVSSLKVQGVGSSVHYPRAIPLFTYYREKYGYKEGQFPVAEWLADQTISLPVGPHLAVGDPERIAKALRQAVAESLH
jgi:perosamine synthetase